MKLTSAFLTLAAASIDFNGGSADGRTDSDAADFWSNQEVEVLKECCNMNRDIYGSMVPSFNSCSDFNNIDTDAGLIAIKSTLSDCSFSPAQLKSWISDHTTNPVSAEAQWKSTCMNGPNTETRRLMDERANAGKTPTDFTEAVRGKLNGRTDGEQYMSLPATCYEGSTFGGRGGFKKTDLPALTACADEEVKAIFSASQDTMTVEQFQDNTGGVSDDLKMEALQCINIDKNLALEKCAPESGRRLMEERANAGTTPTDFTEAIKAKLNGRTDGGWKSSDYNKAGYCYGTEGERGYTATQICKIQRACTAETENLFAVYDMHFPVYQQQAENNEGWSACKILGTMRKNEMRDELQCISISKENLLAFADENQPSSSDEAATYGMNTATDPVTGAPVGDPDGKYACTGIAEPAPPEPAPPLGDRRLMEERATAGKQPMDFTEAIKAKLNGRSGGDAFYTSDPLQAEGSIVTKIFEKPSWCYYNGHHKKADSADVASTITLATDDADVKVTFNALQDGTLRINQPEGVCTEMNLCEVSPATKMPAVRHLFETLATQLDALTARVQALEAFPHNQ